MTLEQYLRQNETRRDEFARELGVSQASLSRYILRRRRPAPGVMTKIRRLTDGAVTADDFYPDAED